MITKLFNNFFSGHHRTTKVKKHILISLLLKGVSILINLLLVPLTINYLSPSKYGIWITLTSVIAWFNFFDVGLGNGLRNKFASAKAEGKDELARTYISTTYAILTIISLILFVLFLLVNNYLNWSKILNVQDDLVEIERLVFIVFGVFCLQFIFKLINTIYIADQRPAIGGLINTVGSLLSLIVIVILMQLTKGSLLYLGTAVSIINLLVPTIAGFIAFNTSYKRYKPSIKFVDFSYAGELASLGFRFFIMQGAALVVYMTDNIIIIQVSGPEDVTSYNVAHKYFGVVTMIFTIITTSLWSPYTEAYIKKDYDWIRNSIKKVLLFWLGFAGVALVMLVFSNMVYELWVGKAVHVPFSLSAVMALYVVMVTSIMVFGNFLSGIGKIQLSTLHAIFVGIINIPLSIFFAKNLSLGSTGVILATTCGVLISIAFQPLQCWKIINGKASGIWNK